MERLTGQKKGARTLLRYGDTALIGSNSSNRESVSVDWGYSSDIQSRKNLSQWIISTVLKTTHISDEYLTAFANGVILRLPTDFTLTKDDIMAEIDAVSSYTGRPFFMGRDVDFSNYLMA